MAERKSRALITAHRRTAWLVGLWFAVGLQPCAVAALSALECPHCPSDAHGSSDAHAHHGDGQAHHGHGAAQQDEPDCQFEVSECCELDEAAFDGRNPGSPVKDSSDAGEVFAGTPTPHLTYVPADEARPDPPDPQSRPRCGRRLHVINCVYLD